MSRLRTILVIAVAALHWPPSSVFGCSHCNIYNYLGESIRGSPNVIIGKAVEPPKDEKVRVLVIRVVRGKYQAGQTVAMDCGRWEVRAGDNYVLSDPDEEYLFGQPMYPCLPSNFEDEVVFLAGFGPDRVRPVEGQTPAKTGNPVVHDVDEAIRRLQGYSSESRTAGIEYIAGMRAHPARQIIDAIDKLRKNEPPVHAVESLVDALMLKPTEETDRFAFEEVRRLIGRSHQKLDWKSIDIESSLDSQYLRALVGCTNPDFRVHLLASRGGPNRLPNPALRGKLRDVLISALPHLDVYGVADVTYTLIETGACTVDELISLLAGKSTDGIALGMYCRGRRRAFVWSDADAKQIYERALAIATQPELKTVIEDGLTWVSKYVSASRPASQASVSGSEYPIGASARTSPAQVRLMLLPRVDWRLLAIALGCFAGAFVSYRLRRRKGSQVPG